MGQDASRSRRIDILAAGVIALAGCAGGEAGDGLAREAVSGQVTLDGEPVDSASIQFIPLDPNAPGGTSEMIRAGGYAFDRERGPIAGTYKVSISTARAAVDAATPPPMPGDVPRPKVDPIPAIYNARTELKAEIKPGGPNTLDFALKTK